MRIIAGKWRGRRIAAPPGNETRPILDRAKTVLFDMIGHRLAEPGRLPPVAVLDLFAGSGALGLEALSRGARFCLFIEQHRPTAALIRRNLDDLSVVDEARVVEADAAGSVVASPPPASEGGSEYELVFVDPPYRFLTGPEPAAGLRRLLKRLAEDEYICPTALIVVRHALQPHSRPDLSPLLEQDSRDVGTMTFRFMTPAADSRLSSGEDRLCPAE